MYRKLITEKWGAEHLRSVFCVVLSCSACFLWAQTDSTLQSVQELQRVEVVAERQTSPIRASVPVQQIDRNRMLCLGLHTMTDALRHMAGITIRDYGGAGGMKTVSVRGIGARHTAVVYDGIALSDCQTGEIDLSRYSLDQLSSLRLVIGDDDNIFQPARNQAAAATLHLETETLSETSIWQPSHAEALLNVGSFGLVNPSFRFFQNLLNASESSSDGVGETVPSLRLTAIGDFFHADNDYPFTLHNLTLTTREHRTNSRMNVGHGELGLTWQPNIHHVLSAKAYYYNNHRRLPGIVHLYTSENHERLAEQTAFGQLRLRSQFSSQWSLLVNAKYNWSHTNYENRTPGSGLGDARYWQREAYASGSLLYEPTNWLSLDYAVDIQHNSLNSTISTYASHPHRLLLLQSLAAKAQWERLTLVARVLYHYSHDSSQEEPSSGSLSLSNSSSLSSLSSSSSTSSSSNSSSHSSFSPSLSLSYRLLPHEQLYLRLMAKRIFRLPTFNELYFYHIGSASLRPEIASQLNLGLTWESRPSQPLATQFTLDAYANRVTDKIVAIPFNMFVWRIMNLSSATILGLDLTANAAYHFNSRHTLALSGNYSLQRAMNTTNRSSSSYHNQLPYTPIHSYCATLSWENPWVNVSASLSGQTARWTTVEHSAGTRIDPFATTDISLWRTFPRFRLFSHRYQAHHKSYPHSASRESQPLTLRFTLQNVFDCQYDLVAHYPMPGRSWRLQLVIPL
ncbi:MAG: TonB-dependent receptor [Prevotella sp.]|nr:TonB-dependent receptor [Prevotella sp.]